MSKQTAALSTEDVPDQITRNIHIEADIHAVWDIVSEPGWFINDGNWTEHEVTVDGDVARVVDPVHGEFSIGIVTLDPPHRAVFRWLGGQAGSVDDFPSNTVEFSLAAEDDGVRLTVVERGFAGLSSDAAVRRQRFEENSTGWETELDVARRRAEGAA